MSCISFDELRSKFPKKWRKVFDKIADGEEVDIPLQKISIRQRLVLMVTNVEHKNIEWWFFVTEGRKDMSSEISTHVSIKLECCPRSWMCFT